MIENQVSEFLRLSAEIKAKDPDIEYVWQVTAGDARRRRQIVPPGAQVWPEDDAGMFDELVDLVERLLTEPVPHAWIEMREHNRSRVVTYVHVDVSTEDEQPNLKTQEASGVIAQQLVKSNEQLLNLLTVKERMVSHLSQKMFDTGLTLRQVETERYMEDKLSQDQSLARAIEALMPMLSVALAKWAHDAKSSKSPNETESPTEKGEAPAVNHETQGFDVEDLMIRIEDACENHKEQLTQERINRVFTAFTNAQV